MRGAALPRVDDELIVRLTTVDKLPAGLVAEMANCTKRTVGRALRRAKVPPVQPARPPYTEDELRWARMMLSEGTPYVEVAATLGRDSRRLAQKLPGYTLSHSEIAEIRHMKMRFERWVEAMGLADVGQQAR